MSKHFVPNILDPNHNVWGMVEKSGKHSRLTVKVITKYKIIVVICRSDFCGGL